MNLALMMLTSFASGADVTVCVKVMTNFTDGGGDHWPTNDWRPARGLHVSGTGGVGEKVLGGNGCAVFTVNAPSGGWTLTTRSEATVNGIHIKSFTQGETSYALRSVSQTFIASDTSVTMWLAPHQTWNNLMVATWAMHRNTFGLGTHSSRGCCHATGSVTDGGLCAGGNTNTYGPWPGDDPTQILMFNDTFDPECCSSHFVPRGAPITGPAVGSPVPWKWATAHELGHTVASERMGKREVDNFNAALEWIPAPPGNGVGQCMGSFATWDLDLPFAGFGWPAHLGIDENLHVFSEYPDGRHDFNGAGQKSNLSMEWQSGAAREGWGDFYAAWLWNNRSHSDCAFGVHASEDYDLDGFIDDNFGTQGVSYDSGVEDGTMDCEGGGPYPGYAFPMPNGPLDPAITARDWLGDVVGAGLCDAPYGLESKATQYDWLRYWWDMTTDEGIEPDVLADVYVDMCPTNWSTTTTTAINRLVRRRIEFSAVHHGVIDAHDAQKDNGVHR